MKIAYNPTTAAALTTAPNNNDITFDLKGLNIFTRGIKFKGTDTTYSAFKKHTSSGSGGYNGLVPVPSYTATNVRFLREDGTWSIPATAAFIYTQLTNQDLDDYLDEGRWYYADHGNTTTNKPSRVDAYELYVGRNASGYRYLKLITFSGLIWFRYHDSYAWKTWVRWYTDMNTDLKVLLSATTTSNYRPLALGYTDTSTTAGLGASVTLQVYVTTTIYAQPSTGSLWANKLYSGGKPVLTEHQSLANYVTLNTAQTITGAKTFTVNVTAAGYKKTNSSDSYVLLGGGGHKAVSDFMLKTESDERYVNVTGDTMTGPLIVEASITAAGGFYHNSVNSNNYVLLAGGSYKSLADFVKGNAGASNRGVYVTNGTVTAMTYYLNAAINSGVSGRLAYYSGTDSIAGYASTVGSSTIPMYLSSGVPTACSGVLVKLYSHYRIYCSGSAAAFIHVSGNFSPISSVYRMDTGKIKINFAYGYSWYLWFVIAVGMMRDEGSSTDNYAPCYVSLWSQLSNYLIASILDDATRNDGSFHFYILVF